MVNFPVAKRFQNWGRLIYKRRNDQKWRCKTLQNKKQENLSCEKKKNKKKKKSEPILGRCQKWRLKIIKDAGSIKKWTLAKWAN